MPLFGSDSNIILTEPNKELSSRDLRSRLQNLIKLLQVSIQRRSETQLTTFHLCLVSSAWEEDKVKPNLKTLLKSKQPVWRMRVKAVAARRSHFRTSWRPWETPRGESWFTIAMWGWRRLTSTSLSSLSWSIWHRPTEHNFLSISAWTPCSWWNEGCWCKGCQEEGRGQRVEETKSSIVWEPDGERNLAARHLSSKIQVDFELLLIMTVILCWGSSWYKLMKENYYRVVETDKKKLKVKRTSVRAEWGARSDRLVATLTRGLTGTWRD